MSEHGGGEGSACGFSHPDQSANWNMAFQSGENSKIDIATLKKTSDPRLVIGGALVFFVGLISLPYIMDAIEEDQVSKPEAEQTTSLGAPPAEAPMAEAPAQEGQIFANGKQIFDAGKAQVMNEALNVSGLLSLSKGARNPAHDGPDMQFNAAMGSPHGASGYASTDAADAAASADAALASASKFFGESGGAQSSAITSGNNNANDYAQETATNAKGYAQETVTNMLAASGMASGRHQNRFVGMDGSARPHHSHYAAAMQDAGPQQQAPVAMAPVPIYGGAVQSATQPYMIYVPGAHSAGMTAYPPTLAQPQPGPTQIAMAPGVQMPAVAQAGHPSPYEHRSAFNPQTSAITAPLGMRHHAGMMPMIPSAGPSGDYSGSGGRMRVFVNR